MPNVYPDRLEGVIRKDLHSKGAYDHVGGAGIVHAACWAHARRKFFEALKVNPKDQSTIGIVAQVDELFAIDGQAQEQGLTQPRRIFWDGF